VPISVFPPQAGSQLTYTKGQVTTGTGGPKALTSTDPNLDASNIVVNTMFGSAHGGAEFFAVIVANDCRLTFERKPFGATGWVPTAALNPQNGIWDYEHRVSDSGGLVSFIVPANGSTDLRMRLTSMTAGGTCTANALATHTAYPTPPRFVGKREVVFMVKGFVVPTTPAAGALMQFDFVQENDNRTRTWTQGVTSRYVRTGRRLWLQSWDATYAPGGSEACWVRLMSQRQGVTNNLADPKWEWRFNNPNGRSGTWPEPLEFPAYLGASSMSIGFVALAPSGGLGTLTLSVSGFETL
jgi:hypothetical protein